MEKKRVIKNIKYFFHLVDVAFELCPGVSNAYIPVKEKIHHKSVRWYEAESFFESKKNSQQFRIIEEAQERPVFLADYYGEEPRAVQYFKSPAIYMAECENVAVIGATALVIDGDKVLYDPVASDTDHRIMFKYGPIKKAKGNRFLVSVDDNGREVDKAINLCGFASNNYYHFTMEILSRLGYIKDDDRFKDYPLLIDEGSLKYQQMRDLLTKVSGDREIIVVKECELVRAKKLVHISMNTWMPINLKNRDLFKASDNLIAESGLMNIREAVGDMIKEQQGRRIFLSRKDADARRISNEGELLDLFKEAGFEVVFTENLSYQDQIELFSSAECVVGASGAAFTNILYCHPGTMIGCLMPKEYEFGIYSSMAYILNLKTLFLDADITFRHFYTGGDICKVDIEACRKYIEALVK